LLGISLHKQTSFPVGKVEFIDLYPLNFHEFLLTRNERQLLQLKTIEVKAEENLQAKSLKSFKQKHQICVVTVNIYLIPGLENETKG
jgi:predicted AAA+ superfamily ATPase